ncbi:MAG: hypothetical protein M3Z36_07560, partial [Acidobacteriota bacterium]|nr:hypothetical protein [Acidobacteriota bacterium]
MPGKMFWTAPIIANILQAAALVALVLYACETWKIRKAAQEQSEGLHKPCVTLVAEPRDLDAMLLEMDEVRGGTIIKAVQGSVALQNIGNGPAINVSYELRASEQMQPRASSYLQNIPAGNIFVIGLGTQTLRFVECEFRVNYESLS